MKGRIFSIERYAVHDGWGIRTIVYLKGCPLRCLWCANPEGQEARKQLFFFPDRCIACGHCVESCPNGAAQKTEDGRITHDPARCRACGSCLEGCYANARHLFGRDVTVGELMVEILKDQPFYRRSGGGVTLSGGEPTMQAEFVEELFAECHRHGIHTAMEGCGYTPWERMEALARDLDLALYDVKHMDSDAHRRLTGVPNELILDNIRKLAALGIPIVVRVPVIPGLNDSDENVAALAEFVASLPSAPGVELLPYHNYGSGKYPRAGRTYALEGLELPRPSHLEEMAEVIRARGLRCQVQ